jgi:hypothetical protein
MPRSRKSIADQSYKLNMELTPLYAYAVPERSRKRLAKDPPKGPLFLEDVNQHISSQVATANAQPLVFVSRSSIAAILRSLGMRLQRNEAAQFAKEINAGLLEYGLRLETERIPLSRWFPRYQEIVVLLRKLRPILPDSKKDELLFNIIRHFGESYAASHGPHLGLAPYELADPLDNFPFPVNYRSDERLEQTIKGLNEITSWMRPFLDAEVDPVIQSNREKMSAAIGLIGYELPRIYEKFFRKPFGATLTSREYGPGIRFILLVLDAAGIVSSTGRKYSAITIKTYRRRARKYAQR